LKNKKTQSNIILDSQSEERIVIKELSNGLRVVAEEMPAHFPCSISISILSGSRDEIDVPNGTAHFLEHIVFRRTKRLKSKQIAKEFEKYGAIANAFTTKEYTSYFATANSNNLKKVN
jgi:predicted Zn-dependent peptidase